MHLDVLNHPTIAAESRALCLAGHLQDNRRDGEELARGRELHPVVHLLPVREQAGFALVRGLEWRPFDRVQEEVHALPKQENKVKNGKKSPTLLCTGSVQATRRSTLLLTAISRNIDIYIAL